VFERVYTVWNYFDGPREGIADYRGQPHHDLCEWNNERDDYGDAFTLCRVDSETMDLVVEQWKIWRTWETAFLRAQYRMRRIRVLVAKMPAIIG
jgi:hypothetical protein